MNRQEMQDLLFQKITEEANANETNLALGRDFTLKPNDMFPDVRFREGSGELESLLEGIADKLTDAGLRAKSWWAGDRENGETVIHVVHL